MDALIPKPFLLNPYKHHSGFLKSLIHKHKKSTSGRSELDPYLQKIGNCMIDLYFGQSDITDIIREIENHLKREGIYHPNKYIRHLTALPKRYLNVQISDGSNWTLLIGDDESRYIHIHPARGSKHSVRIRAIALKTALILKIYYFKELESNDMVSLINHARQNYLDESPIKNYTYTKGVRKALDHL